MMQPAVHAYQPRPGRLLLFPGYFYHCTVPFISTQRRISIAFDVVPEESGGGFRSSKRLD